MLPPSVIGLLSESRAFTVIIPGAAASISALPVSFPSASSSKKSDSIVANYDETLDGMIKVKVTMESGL
jgi:hypothetical protein